MISITTYLTATSIATLCVAFGSVVTVGIARLIADLIDKMFHRTPGYPPKWVLALISIQVGLSAAYICYRLTLALIVWACF
jgi:hypothetical protein